MTSVALDASNPAAPTDPAPDGQHRRITPNLFSISFGLAGVAEVWHACSASGDVSDVPANAAWILTGVVWALILGLYLRDVAARRAWATELRDPTSAPFVVVATIVPMLCGAALADTARTPGVVVWAIGLVTTIGLGGWLSGEWIVSDIPFEKWHPGYFLPTVAGGLLAASTSAQLGYESLARVLFGYGAICWLVLGSILLLRLCTQPRLPVALLPTMAIEVAPPTVAGAAWFAINGGQVDGVAYALAGYAALMVMVQLRLFTLYTTVPFGPGWWAFTFSYAAVAVDGIDWLGHEHTAHAYGWSLAIAVVVTAAIVTLLVRTGSAVLRGTFLPPPATRL